jgi:GNAT superfamily N-acetyltransferase
MIAIRPLTRSRSRDFLALIDALADFEKLPRPTPAARKRLLRDAFGPRRRFDAYLAFAGTEPVGYAIIFETYSSFRAQPTLYLEDIFILPAYRRGGVGRTLFATCLAEAKRRGCGRMEWVVLDWNVNAIRFYEKIGAARLHEWLPYRIDRERFSSVLRATGRASR